MSFLGGPKIINKDPGPWLGEMQDFYNQLGHGSKGERMANKLLKGLYNDPANSPFFDVFKYKAAAAMRDADRNQDPFLPPELAGRQTQLEKDRIEQDAMGQASSAYQGAFQNLLGLSNSAYLGRQGLRGNLLEAGLQGQLGSQEVVQTPGWGNALFSALGSAGSMASGFGAMGWTPFSPTK